MRIVKQGAAQPDSGVFDERGAFEELVIINALCKRELIPEEVFLFSVLLCDNEVDRDFERFTAETLSELKELFVGVTGISDHEWSSDRQVARIYRTELLTDAGVKNSLGEDYMYLKGHAYILRTKENEGLIADIEGGIKRETSVGCSVAKSVCSICGEEIGLNGCVHVRGREYGGRLCHAALCGAADAYEWSFVAVPAQRNAGVMKKFGEEDGIYLKRAEHDELFRFAAAGRRYIDELRAEVLRLALLCDPALQVALLKTSALMSEEELAGMKESLENRLLVRFPPATQLKGARETIRFDGGEFMV